MATQELPRVTFETARLRLARVQHANSEARESGFRLLTQVIADALKVDRAGVWMLEECEAQLVCRTQFVRDPRRHETGHRLATRDFPRYLEALHQRRAIAANEARVNPATAELGPSYLGPLGIVSMLDAPIIRDGAVIGVLCVEATTPRSWEQAEIDFASSAADIAALILEQAERVELESALKLQTEQRLEQQKFEALAHMARSVAHDLNNLLTVVMGVADETSRNQCVTCRHAATNLGGTAEVGRRLVRQLLDLGRRERDADRTAAVDLTKVLDGMLATLRALIGDHVTLTVSSRASAPVVRLERSEMEQVILNLVINAKEAITARGAIQVIVREPAPGDELSDDRVVLEVRDDGAGMDEHTRAHLFEPYFTTKENGHGLGLATVYGIVKRAGGHVQVASERGRGCTVRVVLPRDLRLPRRPG